MTKPNHTCGAIPAMIRGILCLIFFALPLAAQSLSRLRLEESTDLQTWQSIAVTPEMIDANGRLVMPTDTAERFYRMRVELIQPPSLSAQPSPATVASGSGTTLSVTASGTGPFTYQWYQGAVGVTTTPVGTNSASFATPALSETTTYWVRITNAAGSVDSGLATVTVATAPSITTQPASTTITSGSSATLTVTASGTAPLTYQWYQGAVGSTTSPVGTNSASFTTAALTATTSYWVRVSDSAGNVNSALATVTVMATGGNFPDGAEFALIPAGSFQMGDNFSEGYLIERPVHTVDVSAFYMGKYEVTKALWDSVRNYGAANGYTDLPTGGGKGANHPVHTISWYAIAKWCNARSQREGLTPCYTVGGAVYKTGDNNAVVCNWSAGGYRLPTEAEWEKAARGGLSGKRFPWGDTISHSQANYYAYGTSYGNVGGNVGYHPTYGPASPNSSPVGSFAPNGYELYDMAGNMWEWCWDWFDDYYKSSPIADPRGPSSGVPRAHRGGGWGSQSDGCRVASRNGNSPGDSAYYIGFRVARSSVP